MWLCFLLPLLSRLAFAQAVLEGVVLDETKAVIPGAELSLRVKATNALQKTITSAEGAFRFVGLPTGAMELTAQMPGFALVRTSLDVTTAGITGLPNPFRSQKLLLGGWSLNGGLTLQSGTAFSITGAATANAYWAQVSRVRPSIGVGKTLNDVVKTGSVQSRVDRYFDPTAFVNSDDQWGNLGRNILRGPAQRQVDVALAKSTRITERWASELRWEVFNLLNQATFANPAAALPVAGYGTMGQITSTIGGPRTMQLALRLKW